MPSIQQVIFNNYSPLQTIKVFNFHPQWLKWSSLATPKVEDGWATQLLSIQNNLEFD